MANTFDGGSPEIEQWGFLAWARNRRVRFAPANGGLGHCKDPDNKRENLSNTNTDLISDSCEGFWVRGDMTRAFCFR